MGYNVEYRCHTIKIHALRYETHLPSMPEERITEKGRAFLLMLDYATLPSRVLPEDAYGWVAPAEC